MIQVSNKVFKTDSPVNEFVHESVINSSGDEVVFVNNDLCVLFDQQRLSNHGVDTIEAILASFAPNSTVNQELRSKLSDDQLLSHIKSRHIQSQSDLMTYFNLLERDKSLLYDEIELAKQDVTGNDVNVDSSVNKTE